MGHKTMCSLACCRCAVKENMKLLQKLCSDPAWICKGCGRVSSKKEFLCHPKKL